MLATSHLSGFNGRYRYPDGIVPAFSDVLLLMPMSESVAVGTSNDDDKANSPLVFNNFSDFSLDSFSTSLSSDTLFGVQVTQYTQGSGFVYGGNSYTNNWHNYMTNGWSKLALADVEWTIEVHYKLDLADGNNCGGVILTAGGIGYALGGGLIGGYSTGRYTLAINSSGQALYSQGAQSSGSGHQTLTTSALGKGEFNHLVVQREKRGVIAIITIYCNGQLVLQQQETTAMSGTGGYFGVGGMWQQATPGPAYPFRGKMANLRITQRALYPNEFNPPTAPYPLS